MPALAYYDWRDIDRTGPLKSAEDGQIKRNIWDGYSQDQAVELLNTWPKTLRHGAYRQLAKQTLLSHAPESSDDIESPALLSARIQKLIDYGLIEDAQALYQTVSDIDDAPNDFDLAMIGLQFILLNGELAPMCLDVQASSADFRDMPAWRELSKFCRLRFGSGEKVSAKDLDFKVYPILSALLKGALNNIDDDVSSLELLIAAADNKISDGLSKSLAKNMGDASDLFIYLSTGANMAARDLYQCHIIESAKRGVRDDEFIRTAYANKSFPDDLMSDEGGQVTLHPCDIPAYFYQRIENAESSEDKDKFTNTLMNVSKNIPLAALKPLMIDVTNTEQWQSALLHTYAYIKDESDNKLPYPLKILKNTNRASLKEYENWANTPKNQKILLSNVVDPAALFYILQINSGDINKLQNKNKKNEYEKLFSLTYENKSIHLGLGFNDFMSNEYNDGDHIAVITHTLSLLGDHDVKNIHPEELAVILSTLKAYKLEKEAVTLSLEYLQ